MSIPTDPVVAILDAMIARLKPGFGWDETHRALKTIEGLEYAFDSKTHEYVTIHTPAIYIVPLGWKSTGQLREIEIAWALYAISDRATPAARTRGASAELGVHEIAARAHALIDDWVPPVDGASSIVLRGCENLSGLTLAKERKAVLALTGSSKADIALPADGADLDDFLRFHADWDLAPFADPPTGPLPIDNPDATLDVTLPGAGS